MQSIVINELGGSRTVDSGVQAFILTASGAGVSGSAEIYNASTGAAFAPISETKWGRLDAPIGESKILNVNIQVDTIHVELTNALEFDIIKK